MMINYLIILICLLFKSGYKGLKTCKTTNDIAKRKGLRYREDILDNMESDELIANLFRISQTEQKLKKIM